MWRPEGWKNPYPDNPRERIRGGVHSAYEAGADAMHKAIVEWLKGRFATYYLDCKMEDAYYTILESDWQEFTS